MNEKKKKTFRLKIKYHRSCVRNFMLRYRYRWQRKGGTGGYHKNDLRPCTQLRCACNENVNTNEFSAAARSNRIGITSTYYNTAYNITIAGKRLDFDETHLQ